MADALVALAQSCLDNGHTPAAGGTGRPHLTVLVDLATVDADLTTLWADGVTGAPAPDDVRWAELPPGQTEWGGVLSPQAVRRILCDAAVTRLVTNGTAQPIDVGRADRNWSGSQRRAVNARDRHCRGPVCTLPIGFTHIHHVAWWERDDGPTSVDNGIALCSRCHGLVHDRGWILEFEPASAEATWTSPTGRTITTRPPPRPSIEPPESSPGSQPGCPPGVPPDRPPGPFGNDRPLPPVAVRGNGPAGGGRAGPSVAGTSDPPPDRSLDGGGDRGGHRDLDDGAQLRLVPVTPGLGDARRR